MSLPKEAAWRSPGATDPLARVTAARAATHERTLSYEMEPLTPTEAARWDELIAPFESRGLFHRREWLDYLAESRGAEIRLWAIRRGRDTVGYFCGGILQKGPFQILGSPLKSWGTNFMGPMVNGDIDHRELLRAFDLLARAERLAMTELENRILLPDELSAAGYESAPSWTYLVRLTPGHPEAMWRSLDSTCRNRIRKSTRAGLTVEDAEDPAVAEDFYDQYLDVMRRKGLAPFFPREHAQLLVHYLKKADLVFALRVRDRTGRVLATGLFPHDDRTMYFWGGASWSDSHDFCPNDYLHWSAMCLAAERGLQIYNMSGFGRFKKKFGGTLTEIRRWHKYYWRSARWARSGYELFLQTRMSLVGQWRRVVHVPIDARPETRGACSARAVVSRSDGATGAVTLAPPMADRPGARADGGSEPLLARGQRLRPAFRWSDIWKAPLHDLPIRDEILYQYLTLSADMRVLEVGPGSGFTAFQLSRHVGHLSLLEIAADNVAQLRVALGAIPNITVVRGDICAPRLARQLGMRFDAAFGLEVFELLPDPAACLRNLAAVLRPGGTLLLQFPNYPPPLTPGVTHFHSRAQLARLLAGAGFERWTIGALQLRRHARVLYHELHERPLRAYRRLRRGKPEARPLIYDQSWAFQHRHRLEAYKYTLHTAWALLLGLMRLGGDCFEFLSLGEDILNRNLLVLARRAGSRTTPK